jgi:hypothetical protein
MHHELSSDSPTILVAMDLLLYGKGGKVADMNAKNALPLQLEGEIFVGPDGKEYVVVAVLGHYSQTQDRGHYVVQGANFLANDEKLIIPAGALLNGAEVAGIILTDRSRLHVAPTLPEIRRVYRRLCSAAAEGDGAAKLTDVPVDPDEDALPQHSSVPVLTLTSTGDKTHGSALSVTPQERAEPVVPMCDDDDVVPHPNSTTRPALTACGNAPADDAHLKVVGAANVTSSAETLPDAAGERRRSSRIDNSQLACSQ